MSIVSMRCLFNCIGFSAAMLFVVAEQPVFGFQEAGEKDRQPSAGMMRYPDVSKTHIAFSYGGDLWIVEREGGVARPLATSPGRELFPRFNAAGDKIAFTGNYDGNNDLYVIGVNGGVPVRMTWHPQTEVLCDWTPDGGLLFSGTGFSGLERAPKLFTVHSDKPLPQPMTVPYGTNGTISADGKWLAYTPHSHDNRTWKRYQGGMASDVWLFNLETSESRQVTDWEGADSLPMWHGSKLYFVSDAGPEHRLNIWEFDPATGNKRQVTDFADFDCKWPSIGPGKDGKGEIIVENGAKLWLVDLSNGARSNVSISVPGDRTQMRSRLVDVSKSIESADVSPKARRVVVEARGDIWSLPAKSGSPRNMTRTSGIAERMPSWSPDGKWIAFFSDKTGEYELYLMPAEGRGETRQLTSDGKHWRYNPVWSPDSKHIVFTDKAGNIFLHTIDPAGTKLIDTDPASGQSGVSWSLDSQWLTWSRVNHAISPNTAVFVYNVASGDKKSITSFFSAQNPVFDRKGDYIFCSSNRAFESPGYEDVGTTFIYSGTEVLLAIPLRADVKQPLLPESDEESAAGDDKKKEGDEKEDGKDKEDGGDKKDGNGDAPAADPVSGSWSGRVLSDQIPEEQRNFSLTLTLGDGNKVTGSVNTAHGSLDISSGTFDPASGELVITASGGEVSVTMTGTISDGKLTGSASIDSAGISVNFEATRDSSGSDDDKDAQEGEVEKEGDDKKKEEEKKAEVKPVVIEFDGIAQRTWQIPVPRGNFGQLAVNDKGLLIYSRRPSRGGDNDPPAIKIFDITDKKKEEKSVVDGGGQFQLTPDGKKMMISRGDSFHIVDAAAGQKLEDKVITDGMKSSIEPRAEWQQVLNDAWRVERDFFYDPNMHGVNWSAIRDQYAAMIDDCTSRADLGFVISEMISELNVGHAYYRPSPEEEGGPSENAGLPGCRFEIVDGRYRIAEIYEGAAWDTDARSPLRAVGIKEGEFMLEVNGVPLDSSMDPYSAFAGMADKVVTLTISEDATLDDKDRQVPFKLLGSDNNLRFRGWIEKNRRYVEEKTAGKVGYIYVINTGVPGQNDLFRQFYGQMDKEALIIDDRWNGGGQIPTRFIELLDRPVTNYWAKRDGRDWTWPPDSHQGPKCMLINGMAGSGGDMFPALFRQKGLGQLIGMRTWGGLVGISGNPSMIDGSSVTAPTFAYYEKDGTWGIEGYGVDPTMKVVDDPKLMVNNGDPQLDAGIELMLKEIKENGYKAPARPAYPDRSGMGIREEDK
jgi:tricorn protease